MKPDRGTGFRWVVCALLFAATAINYIDRQILSLVKEFLDAQFHWSKFDFGLVNALFQGAYAAGLLFFGWFIDRFGEKKGYLLAMLGWSTAACAHALVRLLPATGIASARMLGSAGTAVAAFGLCRIALGLAEAGNFPAAVKATARWFPRAERAYATSLFNAGSNVGAMLAPIFVPALALAWGWGAPFLVAGGAGLLWLAFWSRCYAGPEHHPAVDARERQHILSDREDAGPGPVRWRVLLRQRAAWSFIAAKFLTDPVWWFLLIWLPDFFRTTRGLDLKHSWSLLALIYGAISVLSVFGGWFTGRLTLRGWSVTRARKTAMVVCACCVVPVCLATRTGTWGAVALLALAGGAHQAWSANLYSTVSDLYPKSAVASLVSLGTLAGSLGGMAFPLFAGWLLDHRRAAGSEASGYGVLFALCSLAYLAAFGINHLLAPRFVPAGGAP